MINAQEIREIEVDFDIREGRRYLHQGVNLTQGDILKSKGNLDELVAIMAPLSTSRLPAHVLALKRLDQAQICFGNYLLCGEGDREFLVIISKRQVIGEKNCAYGIYDFLLREAGR